MNISWLLHVGMTLLGYSEREVMDMTPRKFFMLYEQLLDIKGYAKKSGKNDIDELP